MASLIERLMGGSAPPPDQRKRVDRMDRAREREMAGTDSLINSLGPLLEWAGNRHRNKGPMTDREKEIGIDILKTAGMLAPVIGTPISIAIASDEAEKAKAEGREANAAPLLASLLPNAGRLSRMSRGAHAAEGLTRMLEPAALVGVPVAAALSPTSAQADEAQQPDAVRSGLESELTQIDAQLAELRKRAQGFGVNADEVLTNAQARARQSALKAAGYDLDVDGAYGAGSKQAWADYQAKQKASVDQEISGLMGQRSKALTDLRAYKSPEDIEAMEGGRWDALKTGGAIGAGAALPFVLGAALKRGRGVRNFDEVAGKIATLDKATAGTALPRTAAADEMAALVNEAYRAGDTPMPFLRHGKGDPKPAARLGGRAARLRSDENLFRHSPHIPAQGLLPTLAYGEGAYSTARGMGALEPFGVQDTPEEKAMWTKVGLGSIAAATGFKGARKIGDALVDSALPAASAANRATVNQARTRLERELVDAEPEGLLASLVRRVRGGAGASSKGAAGRASPGTTPPAIAGNTEFRPSPSVSNQSDASQGLLEKIANPNAQANAQELPKILSSLPAVAKADIPPPPKPRQLIFNKGTGRYHDRNDHNHIVKTPADIDPPPPPKPVSKRKTRKAKNPR